MLLAEDLLVVLEGAVAEAGTHEVVVAEAGREAAADSGPRALAVLTALLGVGERQAQSKSRKGPCR